MLNRNLQLINEIIKASVIHGGDAGGPYYYDKESVIDAMKKYMETFDKVTEEKVFIDDDNIPQFRQRDTIYNDQDKNGGEGIYVYTDGEMVYVDSSAEGGYASNWAEIPKENFKDLFSDEFANFNTEIKNLKAENENLKKLLSIAKGD